MSGIQRTLLATMIVLLLAAGCSRDQPAETAPDPAPVAGPDAEPAPPTEPEPSLQAPAEPVVPAPVTPDPIAAGTGSVTGFHGFGPARFGDNPEAVRIAWGRPLVADRESTPDTPCVYLYPEHAPADRYRIAFMLEYDRFVRYDVTSDEYEAPGSARVGNNRDALHALYAGRYQEQPHKYIEGGRYLSVDAPDGGGTRLVFEIDADGVVSKWRIGVPPQVDYVEGCS